MGSRLRSCILYQRIRIPNFLLTVFTVLLRAVVPDAKLRFGD